MMDGLYKYQHEQYVSNLQLIALNYNLLVFLCFKQCRQRHTNYYQAQIVIYV